MAEYTEDYECAFCLALAENVQKAPDRCERCEMVVCHQCGTWLKERDGRQSNFCYGCGTIKPETSARFSRTSSIGCCYMEREWQKRNRGRDQQELYSIATGWKTVEDKEKLGKDGISSWVTKTSDDGKHEDVRELTDDEKFYLAVENFRAALREVIEESAIDEFLERPNPAFNGKVPLQMIREGETSELREMLQRLRSGEPT